MSLVRLDIKGISYSQTQSGAYALILNEIDGERKLPIVIGAFEAQSIAIALEEDISPPRPLTHDLFKNFAEKFKIVVKQVIIHKLVDGVFYSSLICERDNVEEIIDSRTSDAIALALRFEAPIFTYKNILDKAGIHLKINSSKVEEQQEETDLVVSESIKASDTLEIKTMEELEVLLNEAISNENYEKAAHIRDEMSKRSK